MIHQLVLLIFALFAVSAHVHHEMSGEEIPLPCPVVCSWMHSHAWAKAISFDKLDSVSDQNGVFGIMCGIYREYQTCLRGKCVVDNFYNKPALDASPTYDQVCTNKKTEFDSALPCLYNNTELFRTACESDKEHLLAASVRLSGQRMDSPVNIPQDYCSTANRQLLCILPIIRQTCGEAPYNLIRSIINATLVMQQRIKTWYPNCAKYFDTVANGIPALTTSAIHTTTPSTFAANSAEPNSTAIDTRIRDDAAGPTNPDRAPLLIQILLKIQFV